MRRLTLVAPALLLLLALPSAAQEPGRAPNIVLILADDLGMGDVGAYGGTTIATPHVDALAARGVRFTQAYVSHPVCSPSRAGLLTGRYQQRHGWEFNPAGRDRDHGLSLSERTIAQRLGARGYATGMVGKWHLGSQPEHRPLRRGFDEFFGILEGGSTYFDGPPADAGFAPLAGEAQSSERGNTIWRGDRPVRVEEYLTDAFTNEAVSFIERHWKEPFFLYLSYTAPHTPLEAAAPYVARYAHIEDPHQRVYAAMVAALDDGVGAVVERLESLGIDDHTLLVFASDNGCPNYVHGACSNAPLAGYKRYHLEGGVRVPFILHWPARLPTPAVYDAAVSSLDLMATFLAAAGGEEGEALAGGKTLDGVDLLPFLDGSTLGAPHEMLFWRSGPTEVVRAGRWKLLRLAISDLDPAVALRPPALLLPPDPAAVNGPFEYVTLLYDVEADPGERRNLASEQAEIVARLTAAYEAWAADLAEPVVPPVRTTLAEIDGRVVRLFF